jgi:hypothetical protein
MRTGEAAAGTNVDADAGVATERLGMVRQTRGKVANMASILRLAVRGRFCLV